jgi:hypothetical protein
LLIGEKHIKDLIKRSARFEDVASLKSTAGHKSITEVDVGSDFSLQAKDSYSKL